MSTIALDFDDTLTSMSGIELNHLSALIGAFKENGRDVRIVTWRSKDRAGGNEDVRKMAERLDIDVTYTAGRAKAGFVDGPVIWWDDAPESIIFDRSDLAGL